jgi:hypothetical protein
MTEQKIREAFSKEVWSDTVWEGCGPTALDIYTAGYLAMLNSLERAGGCGGMELYYLPNGVTRD